jgi:hypothetical protein
MGERGLGRLTEQDRHPVPAPDPGGGEDVGKTVRLPRDPAEAAALGAAIRVDQDQGVGIRPLAIGDVDPDIVARRDPPPETGGERGMVAGWGQQSGFPPEETVMLMKAMASGQTWRVDPMPLAPPAVGA